MEKILIRSGRADTLSRARPRIRNESGGAIRVAARFTYEAELLARLSHPAIVTIHDFGKVEGLYFLVMEFIDGVNLRDVIRDEKIAPREALAIVPTICEALQFAHDQGIVHRDIKPENILLDKKGCVKIADFGIATLDEMPSSNTGTPQYMAPEQEDKSPAADHCADIYALGVVFYEILTGERPQAELIAPSRKVDVDIRLDEIVLRALEKEPEKRYQTADEFRTVVETIADRAQATSPATPTSPSASHPSEQAAPVSPAPAPKSGNYKFFLGGYAIGLLAQPKSSQTQNSIYLLMGIRHEEGDAGKGRVIESDDLAADKALSDVLEEYRER